MSWLVENWFLIIATVAVASVAGVAVYKFYKLPTKEQLQMVREWLLYAVSMAEKEYGGGTGKLKLRYVYDWFLQVFPWLAKVVGFELFSSLVDDALEEMKKMLKGNDAVKELVENETAG